MLGEIEGLATKMTFTLIFDFDGTLADTRETIFNILNNLAPIFHFRKVDKREALKLRHKESQEIVKVFGISRIKLPWISKRAKADLSGQLSQVKPVYNIKPVVLRLKRMKFGIGILTSNSRENVLAFLKRNDLDVFDFIYSGSSIFGKAIVLKRLLKNRRLKSVVYIGDETRDIEAAKKASIPIIAVSWGVNSAQILKKHKPDFLVRHPKQLIKILSALSCSFERC